MSATPPPPDFPDLQSPADPDAAGLPPHATLPEPNQFRRGQLWALAMTNLVALLALLLWWGMQPDSLIAVGCAALVGIMFLVNITRWFLSPHGERASSRGTD